MSQKDAFVKVIEKIGHEFLLSLYYLVCSCTNTIFVKILVSEICEFWHGARKPY